MSTLPLVELGVLGPVQVRQDGKPVTIPGAKPRAILTMLGLHDGSVVSADALIELLWGDDPPRTAAKALQTHISSLRRTLGDGVVVTEGTGWTWQGPAVDATRYKSAARAGREAAAAGDTRQAVARFEEALALWRGIPELPDGQRGTSEKTRWIESHAALVEDRADALLATGRAAEIVGELEGAVADAPLRERRWGQLILALYRAGRQGEALRAYQRARALLVDELGVDPGPDLRRLEEAFNGHEMPPTTPDWVNVDHRRGIAFAPGDMMPYIRATWDVAPDIRNRLVAVDRLSDLGAVVTQTTRGISQEGFEAEWREIALLTVEGDLINRIEVFDEPDLDAALARFEELHRPAPPAENTASQVGKRYLAHYAAADWDAAAEMLANDFSQDDRRAVVGAGIRHGRDAQIVDMRTIAGLGITNMTSTLIAKRGERLALMRVCFSLRDQGAEGFGTEVLGICEINADERMVAAIGFDPDDIDAAFGELDARYLAGEPAVHAHTWSVITRAYAAFNRHELPSTAPGSVYIDHRPLVTIEAVDLDEFTRATWDLTPDASVYIEAVHSLSDLGAVITNTARGISHEDFDAEWRMIEMFTVEGDLVSRCEIFDEADLDAALARFDELQ